MTETSSRQGRKDDDQSQQTGSQSQQMGPSGTEGQGAAGGSPGDAEEAETERGGSPAVHSSSRTNEEESAR